MTDFFRKFAKRVSELAGSVWMFFLAAFSVLLWGFLGPFYGFSDTWQLVINTATTIMTFLMVFLIQNTQNRDAKAIHIKLDELIRATGKARNRLVDIEDSTDEELEQLHQDFVALHEYFGRHREAIEHERRNQNEGGVIPALRKNHLFLISGSNRRSSGPAVEILIFLGMASSRLGRVT